MAQEQLHFDVIKVESLMDDAIRTHPLFFTVANTCERALRTLRTREMRAGVTFEEFIQHVHPMKYLNFVCWHFLFELQDLIESDGRFKTDYNRCTCDSNPLFDFEVCLSKTNRGAHAILRDVSYADSDRAPLLLLHVHTDVVRFKVKSVKWGWARPEDWIVTSGERSHCAQLSAACLDRFVDAPRVRW